MEDQNQINAQAAMKSHSTAIEEPTDAPSTGHPPLPGRRSGGPRTAQGKRRSSQNAHKHGLYTDERFLESAALELGEDPRQFQRLLKGLVEARRPVGALELALVEDLALLFLKKARLDKAELAVQVSNLHQHDLERRKQMIQVGHADSDASEFEVREKGLRRALDSPGKYEQVLSLLGSLLARLDNGDFGYGMQEALRALYGTEPTLRGAELDTLRYKLSRTKPQEESFEPARKAMTAIVAEESAAVERQYALFLREHVEGTRAARVAATAPSHAQWAAIIRQQNSLHRQMERKIRLLMELQRERRELDETPFGGAPANGSPAQREEGQGVVGGSTTTEPTTPNPSLAKEGSRFEPDPAFGLYAENTKNRGNELEDVLQTLGIRENTPSKRTGFCPPNETITTPVARVGVGLALPSVAASGNARTASCPLQ